MVFMSFSAVYTKTMKTIETVKASGNLLLACQDNWNNLWLLLHRFQKFALSVKTIRLRDNDILRFQIFPLWRPFSKVIVFSENDHHF